MNPFRSAHRAMIRLLYNLQRQPPATCTLSDQHLSRTRLLPDRAALLRCLPTGGVVMECGVDEGLFSEQILSICQPKRLLLVDSWVSQRFNSEKFRQVQDRFADSIRSGQVQIDRRTSVEALSALADHSLDWIYIDTDHSYTTTRDELRLAALKVKSDGYICGHDYTIGSWPSYHRYGVIEAVNTFCVEHSWRFAYLTHEPNRNLSFALNRLSPNSLCADDDPQ